MTDPISYVESQLQSIQKEMAKLHANIDRLVKEKDAMRVALADMFALIDEGYLVRNTSDDSKPGWAMKQLPFVYRLQKAHAALGGES